MNQRVVLVEERTRVGYSNRSSRGSSRGGGTGMQYEGFSTEKDGERLFVTFSGRVAGGIGMVIVFYRGRDWQADIPYAYLQIGRAHV